MARKRRVGEGGKVVCRVRPQSTARAPRIAAPRREAWRKVPLVPLQKQPSAAAMGVPDRPHVESRSGQCEGKHKEAGDLVPAVLQPAAEIPGTGFDREHAAVSSQPRRALPLGGIHEFQKQTALAMRKRASMGGGAGCRPKRLLVSRVCRKSETDACGISVPRGTEGR